MHVLSLVLTLALLGASVALPVAGPPTENYACQAALAEYEIDRTHLQDAQNAVVIANQQAANNAAMAQASAEEKAVS
jgi:hypothetical protein